MNKLYKANRKLKCPRCNSIEVDIIDVSNGFTTTFNYNNGYYDEGIHNMGDLSHQEARCCICNHQWRLRKSIELEDYQINEMLMEE